ncbi:MAG TPA: hypothetical protein VGL89_11275 [Candidatus Koribacter sp.]|jgi:hypothetical protein
MRILRSLGLVLLFASTLIAQSRPDNTSYCGQLTQTLNQGKALEPFCEWVLSFDRRLPDIIGDQQTHRYHTDNGKDRKLIDTTSAKIAYIDDRPQFSEIEINHVKIAHQDEGPEIMKLYGAWSTDDFGGALRLLFGPHARTLFTYAGETSWQGQRVLIFNYDVSLANNLRWEIQARTDLSHQLVSTFPAYRGRILLNPSNSELVRFERQTYVIEKGFPLRYGGNQVDYKRLPLGDGTSFVLPVESTVTFCHDEKHHRCEVNNTTFENWQKFGARTRILTGANP